MEKLFVLHPVVPKALSGSRSVEDLPRKTLEGRTHLAPDDLRVFVTEGVVKETCCHPAIFLVA
jgi:hypothetical protein